jgi:putative ABC transport system permease protein
MTQFLEALGIALAAIWANKLRSLLTVLGNIVAVTSIIAVVSLIQGLNATVTDLVVSELGADAFQVMRVGITTSQDDEDRTRNNPRVTLVDEKGIRRFTTLVTSVMAQAGNSADLSYRDRLIEMASVQGVTGEYAEFATYKIEHGRPMNPVEVDSGRNVCLIGWDVADKLFGAVDPVDKVMNIAGVHFRIVGVNEKRGSLFGSSQDQFVVIPLKAFQRLFGSRQSLTLWVKPRDPSLMEKAMDETTLAMRISRRLKVRDRDNFGLLSSEMALNFYHTVTQNIFAVLVGVVALSLVVGGIVIMNIMLMVVTERTQEIGLRKALGARRRDITWQILTESVTLSVLGGIVGTGLGFLAAYVVSRLTPLPAVVEAWSVAMGIGITAVVGLFFGLYPALRAARLDPIEALRKE